MKTYFAFTGGDGKRYKELIVRPSITPNPSQFRIGLSVGNEEIWLPKDVVQELVTKLRELIKD